MSARAANAGQIDLSWSAPAKDGGADIEAYLVQISSDGTNWNPVDPTGLVNRGAGTRTDAAIDADKLGHDWVTKKDANDNVVTSYMHKSLPHETRFYYRVLADNGTLLTVVGDAAAQTAATPKASKPGAPMYLSAHTAADSSLGDADKRGVYLTWLAPSDPAGATIEEYEVVRMITGEDDFVDTVMPDRTFYNDIEELGDQVRQYQVRAVNDAGNGAWSATVEYPLGMHAPGKPTAVMAEKNAEMPASKIKVSWSAPTSGDEVTGYIIERRYGDMMMDITGYSGTDGANRYHAFMNYMEWWETLNCDGMLQAANIAPADATDEQKGMYCKHFLATAPSMVPDTDANADKKISDETAMKVKDLFMKRYVTDDMGKTMTMFTGMMYTDMGLMESTEYTYRVRAIHGMTAGMWSDTAMAMTDRANTAPTKVGTIPDVTVKVDETRTSTMAASTYFSDADEGDTLTIMAESGDDAIASATINADGMIAVTGVAVGSTTVTVTATDSGNTAGNLSVSQTFTVTVESADTTLGNAMGLTAGPTDDNDPGSIKLTWTAGANANIHWVVVVLVDANGDFDLDNSVWEQASAQDSHTVAMQTEGLIPGNYRAMVIAGMHDSDAGTTQWSTWQSTQFTYPQ